MASRLALSIMNSVRVFPTIAAASSMSWRVCRSIRKLMLPFISGAEERSATATAPAFWLSEDGRRAFGIRRNMFCRIYNVNTKTRGRTHKSIAPPPGDSGGVARAALRQPLPWSVSMRFDTTCGRLFTTGSDWPPSCCPVFWAVVFAV